MVNAFRNAERSKIMVTGLIVLGVLVAVSIPVTISHVKK